MALKALKCSNCDANIQIDDEKEYGFCSYCGAQVQLKDIVEVRYVGEVKVKEDDGFDKQYEDGAAYIKMKEYHKAEQILYRVINKYPGKAEGYELLISAITREHTLYIKENFDRIMKMAEKMVAVAESDKKTYYERLYEDICRNFEIGMQEQEEWEKLLKVGKLNKQIKENLALFVVSLVGLVLGVIFVRESSIYPVMMVLLGAMAGVSVLICLACICKKQVVLKSMETDE